MTDSNKNIEIANGWILCPSKSFPGKFYYFNVLNGEAAWSLTQSDNKSSIEERSFHKIADKPNKYPDPTTPQHIIVNTKKRDFINNIPGNYQLPKFDQAPFPKYETKVEPLIPKIVCTSVPFLMLCPESDKPMLGEKLSEIEYRSFAQFSKQTSIPISQRFQNYKKPCHERNNKTVKPLAEIITSTPKNLFLECISESQNFIPNALIKEPTLKLEPKSSITKLPDAIKSNAKGVISFGSKVGSTKFSAEVPEFFKKEENSGNPNSSHFSRSLLGKRGSTDTTDSAVERKKPKPSETTPLTLQKQITFKRKDETADKSSNDKTPQDFITSTPNRTRTIFDAQKSPVLQKDKTPPFIKESPKTPTRKVEDRSPTLRPTANNQSPTLRPAANDQTPTANYNNRSTFKNKNWCIVADTDVLLLDYDLIDKIVLSDPTCTLIIPHAVAADIEELCLGDCHGQQRVINARKLTRKLVKPPPQYIVEPRTSESDNIVVTTDSILHCCMKMLNINKYVVLITNDPHLQIRATLLNIKSYKLNEIKYGVTFEPNSSTKKKTIKNNTSNDDGTDTNNLYNQSSLSNSEMRNDVDGKNHSCFGYHASSIKKQLFLTSDSENDSSLDGDQCTTTQPKDLQSAENINKVDIDGLSDISSEISSLILIDNKKNVGRNPFLPKNVRKYDSFNFEKRSPNPKNIFNHTFSFRKAIPNEELVYETNNSKQGFYKDDLEYNFENTKKPFCSKPITNMKLTESKPELENPVKPVTTRSSSSRQESIGVSRENKVLNPSQLRTQKIIKTLNSDSPTKTPLDNQIPKTKDSTGVFKIPKLLPIKNPTRNTSVHGERTTVNDKIGTRTNIDPIDDNLTRFRIRSNTMKNKIKSRIDEWLCSYMQIMEDALMHILQKNCFCMKNTVAPLTLKETLNCIRMLFGSNTKIRNFTNKLSALLENSVLHGQGNSKMSLTPEDFMKIFGYGVLLVQTLKNILPPSEELKDAESRLNDLQVNLESKTKEFDPELVKTSSSSSLSKSDSDQSLEELRPPFIKKKSYVIDYLKKHFKEWETYKEDLDDQNYEIENHTDFRVVRTLGKNLNLFKIDSKKVISISNNTTNEDLTNKSKDGPKLIKLLENNQINKPEITEIVQINTRNETKLTGRSNNENNQNGLDSVDKNVNRNVQGIPLENRVENIEKERNKESKVNDEFNYTTHENTFLDKNAIGGPKIIRNIQLMDEFEKKLNKDNEPIDLESFYTDISGPPVDANFIDFDVITEENKDSEKINTNNDFRDDNYGLELDHPMCTLEDFYVTPTVSLDPKNNNNTVHNDAVDSNNKIEETKNSENVIGRYFDSVSENNVTNANIKEKTDNTNCEVESETYTEIQESQKGSPEKHIDGSKTERENSKIFINDSGTHLDNSDTLNETFGKTAHFLQDDTTNDSGIENECTNAHSLVRIFLNELSTTFNIIHTFVTKFIEETRETKLSGRRKDALHNQASKAWEDIVAIIEQLKSIIERETAENTVLKILLRNAGVEATTDKRITRYRQVVIKCLEQAFILEYALRVIVSTTKGDFKVLSTNAETLSSSLRYFNIFE